MIRQVDMPEKEGPLEPPYDDDEDAVRNVEWNEPYEFPRSRDDTDDN
jgi:hypothetical protein